ncbi:MAG: flavodoxin family protein [Desulfovermiculus sp.]|nr:flavodoxin family protein [Desulfovermiculus sp.]
MVDLVALYGSPRRQGNTSRLLQEAVQGAREAGAEVREFVLRDLKISPCQELYHCKKSGECSIKDDFQKVRQAILQSQGLMLASPIFFYSVTAQTKILMDRFQSLWVKKYLIDQIGFGQWTPVRQGLFISAGATKGKKLFDGTLLTVKYFFDPLDMALWKSLLYRGLDGPEDVVAHPEYLQEARAAGQGLVEVLSGNKE